MQQLTFMFCSNDHSGTDLKQFFTGLWDGRQESLICLRNYIVAPVTEEFVFRGCMVPLLRDQFSPISTVLLTPVFFGVAHFHHILAGKPLLLVGACVHKNDRQ